MTASSNEKRETGWKQLMDADKKAHGGWHALKNVKGVGQAPRPSRCSGRATPSLSGRDREWHGADTDTTVSAQRNKAGGGVRGNGDRHVGLRINGEGQGSHAVEVDGVYALEVDAD